MLVFLDETFRKSLSPHGKRLGALCGIAIPEKELSRISSDIYQLKLKHFDANFASNEELKSDTMLSNSMFKLEKSGVKCHNLEYARDLTDYICAKRFRIFGCVCFDETKQYFRCEDVRSLDKTFMFIFERLDMFMKIKYPEKMAKLVFDDRDFGTNRKNATAITNFFLRSAMGLSFDSILKTPFFAISQSQNVGLHLADFVTGVIGMRFSNNRNGEEFYKKIRQCRFVYQENGWDVYSLKVIRNR